jgi:molybdopterin/thiamine biosynthesis adenylyltransferase
MVAFDYDVAFQRNFGLLRDGDLKKIRSTRIGIGGLGGCGSNHLLALVRMGFEKFAIADPDTFDQSNFNRQAGASVSTVGRLKVDVMSEMARDINPNCDILSFPDGLTCDTIDDFVTASDIGINAIDWFQVEIYGHYHDTFRDQGKYSIVGASPFAFGCAMTVIGPETPSFRQIFSIDPALDAIPDQLRKFTAVMASANYAKRYLAPGVNEIQEPLENTRIASSASALYLCSALTSAEVLWLVTGRGHPTLAPKILQIDMFQKAMTVTKAD